MCCVPPVPKALTIAGSDSGGCAGIQADLKTFAALGVHGMSAITSVTAQDTSRVYLATDLPLKTIERQIESVIEDIGVNAVKTGMLSSAQIIDLVATKIKYYAIEQLVVDPVMIATGGDPLIHQDAVEVLKRRLLPLASVATPNRCEAELLVARTITTEKAAEGAAKEIFDMGPRAVIVKGGHLDGSEQVIDYFYDGRELIHWKAPRINTPHTHGSGCTFASAIAAYLARGLPLREAIRRAKEYVTEAIRHSFSLGQGHGPLGHFYRYWNQRDCSSS